MKRHDSNWKKMGVLQSWLAALVVLFGVGGKVMAILVGPSAFSSITDGGSYAYRNATDSTNLIDGVFADGDLSGLVNFDQSQSTPVFFTVNMELSSAPLGFDLDTFHIWNDFGGSVSDGVESFTVDFYSLPDAGGSMLSTLSVSNVPGPVYDKTRQDYPLGSTINGVQSLVFTINDFAGPGDPPNGGHIREIGVSVPEPSAFLCLGLIGVGWVAWNKLKLTRQRTKHSTERLHSLRFDPKTESLNAHMPISSVYEHFSKATPSIVFGKVRPSPGQRILTCGLASTSWTPKASA